MKNILIPAFIVIFLAISSCTKTGNAIAPSNTITATIDAGTTNAQTITFISVPSTSILDTGTPFYITGTTTSPLFPNGNIIIDLNNPSCSYPNFVSGTYNLCLTPPPGWNQIPTYSCPASTNNYIQIGDSPALAIYEFNDYSYNNGTVTVVFNNGTATGTFNFKGYGYNGSYTNTFISNVTGSFSVSY